MFLLAIVLVALTSSNICTANNDANNQKTSFASTVPPPTPTFKVNPPTVPILTPDADDSDYDDYEPYKENRHDEFDWKLTKALMLTDSSNMIVSPFSVKVLLSLLAEAAGADTTTHRELQSVLPSITSHEDARQLYGKIFGSLQAKSKNYDLNIGTKIYVDEFIHPLQKFASIVEAFYSSNLERLDFKKAAESAKIINDWCANITQNNIKELVKADDVQDTVIMLLNAIYFNGYWRRPFPANETVQLPFYSTSTTQVKTPFMSLTDNFFYMESQPLNAKVLRLPYKGRKFSMTIVLPNAKGGLDELIRQMDRNTIHRAQWLMYETEVHVQLPKFKFDSTSNLKNVLQDIGIKSIFTREASFPSLDRGTHVEGRLEVSKVLQKAGIDVNEQGSTVYAATQLSIINRFGGETTREFLANRPFLFFIEDETTGTMLFSGKVTNPSSFTF